MKKKIQSLNDLWSIASFADVFSGSIGGVAARWRVWQARRAPTFTPSNLPASGRAKVVGEAFPVDLPLCAPFTLRGSAFWSVAVAEKHWLKESEILTQIEIGTPYEWRVELVDASTTAFWIADEDGARVLVEPGNALLAIKKPVVTGHPNLEHTPELASFLVHHGLSAAQDPTVGGDRCFYELAIEPGQRICVWGSVSETTDVVSSGYRDASVKRKKIASSWRNRVVLLSA
jgi:hypothetical protein